MKVILLFLSSFLALWLLLGSSLSPFLSGILFLSNCKSIDLLQPWGLSNTYNTTCTARLGILSMHSEPITVFCSRPIVVETDGTNRSERASFLHRCVSSRTPAISGWHQSLIDRRSVRLRLRGPHLWSGKLSRVPLRSSKSAPRAHLKITP